MRSILLSLVVFVALSGSALAYELCGNPPDPPELPANPATATADEMRQAQEDDEAYAQDSEGYLICLQLAESDVASAAERGEMTAAAARAVQESLQDMAAQARGKHSGWSDDYDRWAAAWARAHGRPVPHGED